MTVSAQEKVPWEAAAPSLELRVPDEVVFWEPVSEPDSAIIARYRRAEGEESEGWRLALTTHRELALLVRRRASFWRQRGRQADPVRLCFSGHAGVSLTMVTAPGELRAGGALEPFRPMIFLSEGTLTALDAGHQEAIDTALHEVGHLVMLDTHGLLSYPYGFSEYLHQWRCQQGHWRAKATNPQFAFSEGFAEFTEDFFRRRGPDLRAFRRPGTDGGDPALTSLSAEELRVTEGAVAALLGVAAHAVGRVRALDLFWELLAKDQPQTVDEFFTALRSRHPSWWPTVFVALRQASRDRYRLPADPRLATPWIEGLGENARYAMRALLEGPRERPPAPRSGADPRSQGRHEK